MSNDSCTASGESTDIGGERSYAIRNVGRMSPFFISVVSNVDHLSPVRTADCPVCGRPEGRVEPLEVPLQAPGREALLAAARGER
jgi:hypothetical protein